MGPTHMMVSGLSHLVFLVLCGILITSSRINIKKNRPYGPMKCLQECGNSSDSVFLLKEYHCHRISTKDPKTFDVGTSENTFLCSSMYKLSGDGAYLANLSREDTSNTSKKDAFRQRTQETTESSQFAAEKFVKCKDNKLHRACETRRLTKVQRYLSTGYNINCRGRYRRTPVMQAALSGQLAVFDFLVNQRCDMSVVDKNNSTVLHLACRGGNLDIIRKILAIDKYQLEHRGYHGITPVMTAAEYCRKDAVDYLRTIHCNMFVVDRQNLTLLHLACRSNCLNVVDYVLHNGILGIESQGNTGTTPLLTAASHCNREVFHFLITKGANVTARDINGQNILHLASYSNCTNVADYILSENIVSRESRDKDGCTPLMSATVSGYKEMVIFLVSKGCSVKAVNRIHNSILHVACLGGNTDLLKYLLTLKEVDWRKKNTFGDTPMDIAERINNKVVVDLLKAGLHT